MDFEKKMVLNWFLFGLVLLVLLGLILGVMNYVGLFAGTVVERKVYETSIQYTEVSEVPFSRSPLRSDSGVRDRL